MAPIPLREGGLIELPGSWNRMNQCFPPQDVTRKHLVNVSMIELAFSKVT